MSPHERPQSVRLLLGPSVHHGQVYEVRLLSDLQQLSLEIQLFNILRTFMLVNKSSSCEYCMYSPLLNESKRRHGESQVQAWHLTDHLYRISSVHLVLYQRVRGHSVEYLVTFKNCIYP